MEQNIPRVEFNEMIKWVSVMNEVEIDEILSAIINRYSLLLPECELNCIFLPRNNIKERQQIIQQMTDFLMKHPA